MYGEMCISVGIGTLVWLQCFGGICLWGRCFATSRIRWPCALPNREVASQTWLCFWHLASQRFDLGLRWRWLGCRCQRRSMCLCSRFAASCAQPSMSAHNDALRYAHIHACMNATSDNCMFECGLMSPRLWPQGKGRQVGLGGEREEDGMTRRTSRATEGQTLSGKPA